MTNEQIVESVISLLAVDGSVTKEEMQFFNDVCERLDISTTVKKKILAKARRGKGHIHLPQGETEQQRLLYFLVQTVVADARVVQKERKILDAVIHKMGISKAEVEQFIQQRLREIKKERYTTHDKPLMKCPKCGYEQPQSYRCKRCGIIYEKYEKSQESSQESDDAEALMRLLASSNVIKGKKE